VSLLVLDGGPAERRALRTLVEAPPLELTFIEAKDVSTALAALRTERHDCALLDLRTPGADALAVLEGARALGLTIPVIVLAARVDERLAVELMQSGATDYVTKAGFSGPRLRQSIAQAVRVRRAEIAAAAERQRLARLQSFTATLALERTVAEVAETTSAELRAAFRAQRAAFAILTDGDQHIDVIRADGFEHAVREGWRKMPLDASTPLAEVVRLGEPLYFEDGPALAARYPKQMEPRAPQDEAVVALPLMLERRALGSIELIYDRPRRFSEDDRRELLALAGVCAQAVDRAYLFDVAQLERRRAEEANRAKDEFLAVVSHELRTPLNAILGWAKMLNAGALSDEQARKATATIERNALAQAQLIDDLLDVSRIITGQMRIKGEPVDLPAVVEAAIDIIRPAAEAKDVRIQHEADANVGSLLGDADRLQQVFWNLLSNAVKFTPRGGRVAVRLRRVGGSFVVEVEDSGQGIPAEFLPQVFQRFRQHDSSAARKTGGLGLGLAIVRHLVELHGGSVAVASDGLGKGSLLSVRLPINHAFRREAPPPLSERSFTPGAAPPRAKPPTLDGLLALVVDDDDDARDLVASVLISHQARVMAVGSAAEALDWLRSQRPDVIISDIGMPIDDGYALMERVRALSPEGGGRTPAIALTAYAHNADRAKALLAGFTAHATKPIDPKELVALIASVTARTTTDGHASERWATSSGEAAAR
jgi:signal transduction histidine kinase/DNA-binding response OmpR family regulator